MLCSYYTTKPAQKASLLWSSCTSFFDNILSFLHLLPCLGIIGLAAIFQDSFFGVIQECPFGIELRMEVDLYNHIIEGTFLARPNRFVAHVQVQGETEIAHVKNTSRLKELLIPGARVFLEDCSMDKQRKTKYSLIAVCKGGQVVNIDSQIPNAVIYEGILDGKIDALQNISELKREVQYKSSRFDLAFVQKGQPGFVEVKGVTLEKDGVAAFPGAPTTRGEKHILEMMDAVQNGYLGYIIFLIQLQCVQSLCLHWNIDQNFANALLRAKNAGVNILAYNSVVSPNKIEIQHEIPIDFCFRDTSEFMMK